MKRSATLLARTLYASVLLSPGCADDGPGAADTSNLDAGPSEDAAQPRVDGSSGPSDASSQPDAVSSADAGGGGADAGTMDPGGGWLDSKVYSGGEFHLGPVDYEETKFHNACASGDKYLPKVRAAEGKLLAGLWDGLANITSRCDTCVRIQTAKGKSAVLRVVTWGVTTPNSIDVSPEAFALLDSGEYPRAMTWQFTKCPDTGKIMYEFKTGANAWWTAFWVRNARMPITKVEVMGTNHAYKSLSYESDGSLVDASGFGMGNFSIRLTAADGQVVTDSFSWPSPGIQGALLEGAGNFK